MKKALFTVLILSAAFASNAQSKDLKFEGGLDIGIPVSNLSGTSLGVGVDILAHYKIAEQVAITGDFGYLALFAKNGGSTSSLLPLRAGLRFYPSTNFYLGGKIGAGFLSNSGSSVTTTAYSIGGGYFMDKKLEIGASYDGYSKNGTIGLLNIRLGYFF